jgi:hypothetical protein
MRTDEDRLENLPTYDVDSRVAARIRARAEAVLSSEAARAAPAGALSEWFYRVVEPTALIGLGVAQLFWTVHDTFALFR